MQLAHQPWNKGRSVGPRQGLTSEQVRQVRTLLKSQPSSHDLCLFCVAIDTMLRASDLMRLQMRDVVQPNGTVRETFPWKQKKTAGGVSLVLTPRTQKILKTWLVESDKRPEHFLFTREKPIAGPPITVGFYRQLVKSWVKAIGLSPHYYSAHSLRRSKAIFMYERGVSVEIIGRLLGHQSPASTIHYLGIDENAARALAQSHDIFSAKPAPKSKPIPRFSSEELDIISEKIWSRLAQKLADLFDEISKKGRE
ncbi:MAG: hypothetical protein COA84_10960 [Robiginitomaculum sp.]|nr:MAG: hypothetical protein COA84_10960 [Robiginitomaculum sp.]